MTKRQLMNALMAREDLHNQHVHIAMALIMGKSWQQMQTMYGTSLSAGLNALKREGVVVRIESCQWEVVPNPKKWVKKNESAEAVEEPTDLNPEKEATLEMMAQLEKQLNELKKRVG